VADLLALHAHEIMTKDQADEALEFLRGYPEKTRDIAKRLRTVIMSTIPGAREEIDRSARIVGYSLGSGYAGSICAIIPSKKGVKLGIARGAQLADPERLLEGSGKQHRYVAFDESSDLDRRGLQTLLRVAVAAWKERSPRTPKG